MSLAELKKALKQAKTAYKADEGNAKLKKAFKKAKKALKEAKENANQEPENQEPTLESLQSDVKRLKAVWKKDKTDKTAKKAFKAAKAALAAKQENGAEKKGTKRAREEPTLESLKSDVKRLKTVWKQDKTDKKAKKAFKAAKAALLAKEGDGGEAEAEVPEKEAEVPEKEVEAPAPAPAVDVLSAFKSQKKYSNKPENTSEKPPSVRLFCGNLSYKIDDDQIKEFFKECGTIIDIYWGTDRDSGDFKGFGFITFSDLEEAKAAFAMNGESCMGRDIRVDYTLPRPDRGGRGGARGGRRRDNSKPQVKPEGCTAIFVGNVSDTVDDEQITELLKDCGEISDIRWLMDRESGEFKGCGFIEFTDPDASLDKAVALNGTNFLGRNLRVDYSTPRAARN